MQPPSALRSAARAAWSTRRSRALTAGAALLVAALVARAGAARTVPAYVAEHGPLVQRVVASGRVLAPARVALGSLSLARVVEVAAREGDAVRAGQLLLRLDESEARAALGQARARVEESAARLDLVRGTSSRSAGEAVRQAELDVAQAERALERTRRLFDGGAASEADLEAAEEARAKARSEAERAAIQAASLATSGAEERLAAAALRQAQAAEAAARARLDEKQVRAPVAGRILARDAEPGDVVLAGKTLLVLAEDGPARLSVQLDEKSLAVVAEGQEAEAVADAFPERPFPATVAWIAPAVDPARGTVEVRLAVPAPPAFLRPDLTVSVNVTVGRRERALVVPAEAVRDGATGPWVLRAARGRAERRAVKLGLRGAGMVEILEGLGEGDAVVPPAAGALKAGARVRVRRLDSPAEGAGAL